MRLFTLRYKQNQKLEGHFQKFNALIRELESMESKLDEEDKVCHLLLTLDEDNEAVITANELKNINRVCAKSRLLDQELKPKTKQRSNSCKYHLKQTLVLVEECGFVAMLS